MASNMGIPEKKTDTLLYIIIVCCIIAFPVIVLAGYTLEMTADKNGNIQAFARRNHIGKDNVYKIKDRAIGKIASKICK